MTENKPPWTCDYPGCTRLTCLTVHTETGRKKIWHYCSKHIVFRMSVGDDNEKVNFDYNLGID